LVLTTLFYKVPDEEFNRMMPVFRKAAEQEQAAFRVDLRTSDPAIAERVIASGNGIVLLITYVAGVVTEDGKQSVDVEALRIGQGCVRKNRDNYVVYLAEDNRVLLRMAAACTRPAGMMSTDMFAERGLRVMREIFRDFRSLTDEKLPAGEMISLKCIGGKVVRVSLAEVYAALSAQKRTDVHTVACIHTVSNGLTELQEQFGEGFCMCHRGCLINLQAIQYVDFRTMTIYLLDGTEVPLARSFRQAMEELITNAG